MKPTLAVVLVVAACGPKGSVPSLHNDPSGGAATLAQALARDVGAGAAVAIVPGPAGLRAISADGARSQILVDSAVPWALVDNRAEVVWFGSADATQLLMLDLAAPATPSPQPEVIATGLPTGVDPGGPLYAIRHADADADDDEDLDYSQSILPRVVVVVDAAAPALKASGGILDMWDQSAGFEAALAAARFTGAERVRTVATRHGGARMTASAKAVGRVADLDVSDCEDPDVCGRAEAIPGTALWRVAISYSCGDGCYTGWRIYDPARRAFFEPRWADRLVQASVAPDGSAFVVDGEVIRFDSGPLDATPPIDPDAEGGASGGGWLGGVQIGS